MISYTKNVLIDTHECYVPSVTKHAQLGIGRGRRPRPAGGHYYFGRPRAGTDLSRSPLVKTVKEKIYFTIKLK